MLISDILNEDSGRIDVTQYGAWLMPDGHFEYVPSHGHDDFAMAYFSIGNPNPAYRKAFENGWLRLLFERDSINIMGTKDAIMKSWRWLRATALQTEIVRIETVKPGNHLPAHSYTFHIPLQRTKLMKFIGGEELTEDVDVDTAARKAAKSVYRKIIKTVPTYNNFTYGEIVIKQDVHTPVGYITMKQLGMSEYGDLAISVGQIKGSGGLYDLRNRDHSVTADFLLIYPYDFARYRDVAQKLGSYESVMPKPRFLASLLKDEEITFIHEFVHYLDFKRIGKSLSAVSGDDRDAYYNSPLEMNAYYQEAVHALELRRDYKDVITLPFKQFFTKALDCFENGFASRISEDNQKKILKRLFAYWKSHQQADS